MNQRLKVGLTFSIAINVLLVGMMLGTMSHHYITPPPPPAFDMKQQLDKLPGDKRILYNTIMGPAKSQMDEERTLLDALKKHALGTLKAEPFNAGEYLREVDHILDMQVEMKRHLAQAVVNLAAQLTLQERAVLAEIVSHPPFTMLPFPAKPENAGPRPE